MSVINKRVLYVWDHNLIEQCNRLPAVRGRAVLVHDLIAAYRVLEHITVVKSIPAAYTDLRKFHSECYLNHIEKFRLIDEDYVPDEKDDIYGIGYDCFPVSNLSHLVATIAGGSITAAKCLSIGATSVAINWCGGWHHAQQQAAEGFCYVNDIVLAIEVLKSTFHKVLYVDLDVHHGNGVQNAYENSTSVFTLSFHKYEPGFYPGSGSINDIGKLSGEGYSCNFPLFEAYSDATLEYAFGKIFPLVHEKFQPDAIVLQCGADSLAHDPHGGANVTIKGYCNCISMVLDKRKPTLLLGGGGYNHRNTARLWTSITALVAGVELDHNIPEHIHWPQYGPDYMLPVEASLARDSNKKSYVEECTRIIEGNLMKYLNDTHVADKNMPKKTSAYKEYRRQKLSDGMENNKEQCDKSVDVYEFVD